MKFFKQFITAVIASCVFAAGAMAFEPQRNDQKPPPPPREGQKVPNPPKNPPPPPRNDNKGSEGKRGGKP